MSEIYETKYIKKSVEQWLNSLDYEFKGYMPTAEALMFVNFIKEVNAGSEENETPLVHLKMMDSVFNTEKRCAILCHRGIGKTTLFAEYLILFVAAFGYFPGFGKVNLMLYVTDSIENGVKNLRRNVEFRYSNSEFLQKMIPNRKITVGTDGQGFVNTEEYEVQTGAGRKFTDIRLEFKNMNGHTTVVKGYGAKALSLDTILYTANGVTTIGSCKVGDQIYGADGKLATITKKSEIFNKKMYKVSLEDGRSLKVSEDHLNPVVLKENLHNKVSYTEYVLPTYELAEKELLFKRVRKTKDGRVYESSERVMFVRNIEPMQYPARHYDVDPYTLGVVLGDGRIRKDCGSVELTVHKDELSHYHSTIPYVFGSLYKDPRSNAVTQSIRGLGRFLKKMDLNVRGEMKFIPDEYFYGSIDQRTAVVQGLMDTDGTVDDRGRTSFTSSSYQLCDDLANLVRSLGGSVGKIQKQAHSNAYRIEMWVEFNPFKLQRKADKHISRTRRIAVESIKEILLEPSQCIAIDNEERQFIADAYFRTHNTGVRGAKEMGQRPTVALLDDLVSDTDAESATIIKTIENTVYKAVSKALSPTKQKMVWLGTPFNARDPLYKAVESGAWQVSVYPICEQFPVEKKDFKGSWEDRFTYEYVLDEYNEAVALGMPANFNQELMLRIMSDEDRLIQDGDIVKYDRNSVMQNKGKYNFYITTDFATSEKSSADFSVISVWAYNNNGDWLWVDGVCKRQLMDKNINDLFRFSQMYKPQGVGIEVTGQQGGFIQWIQNEMIKRNIFFTLTSENNSSNPGLRPNTNKMVRFNTVVPLFKLKKIWFPEGMETNECVREAMEELRNASASGFKSKHDDFLDTISMLSSMDPWKPSEETTYEHKDGVWEEVEFEEVVKNSLVF